MALILAHQDIQPEKVRTKFKLGKIAGTSTTFFRASPDNPRAPTAYLVRYNAGYFSSAHFHVVDQFQVLVEGKGKFGRHEMSPYSVHFSRAYTSYGPLVSDPEGWGFLTLRTEYDPGAQHFPESRDKLTQVSNRDPWQITRKVSFVDPAPGPGLRYDSEIRDEHGLFTCTLSLAPGAQTITPDPSGGNGQYVIVVKGSLISGGKEHTALTIVFVKPDEKALSVQAGPQGLQALILNFPRSYVPIAKAKSSGVNGFKRWQCELCAFAYDEALGMPAEGIAPGTRWQDVPDSWTCPDCGSNKSDFQMVEVESS